MIEVRLVADAASRIAARCAKVTAAMDLERCQGLEADWTEVAETLEAIRELAEHAAASAWRVSYESQPAS